MEESRIGKPIPIGDIPSLAEDAKAPRVVTHDRPALTDDAHAETVPAETWLPWRKMREHPCTPRHPRLETVGST